MFHLKHIEALLEKYWEGDTSIEEERLLKSYFASNEVDDSLRQFKPLFQVFREEQTIQFSQKTALAAIKPQQYNWKPWAAAASIALLLCAGWWWSVQPDPTNGYVAETIENPVQTTQETQTTQYKSIKTTENSALAMQVTPAVASQPRKKGAYKPQTRSQLNQEEEQAMAEIKAALALVSSKMNKGRREAAKGATHLENVDRIFKKKKDSEG